MAKPQSTNKPKRQQPKVNRSAVKIATPKQPFSFRRNILPPLLGVGVFLAVFGLLNAEWITAQAQYRFIQSSPITVDLVSTAAPTNYNQIIIPKIGVDAPVIYDETSLDEARVQKALQRGTVHYGNTALPGQNGAFVIVGHSSGQLWAPGDYKFVFTLLSKLKNEDKIVVDYKGTRYIYVVNNIKVVQPDDFSVLNQSKSPTLVLITCSPVGSSKSRLIVTADQISPKPIDTPANKQVIPNSAVPNTLQLPATAKKSLWQSIVDWF